MLGLIKNASRHRNSSFGTYVEGIGYAETYMEQIRENKIQKYTQGYQQDIEKQNDSAVASAAAYLYAKEPENAQAYVDQFLPGYVIDPNNSSKHHVTLVSGSDAILAYKGTNAKDFSDLKADFDIAVDGFDYSGDTRFEQATAQFDKARADHPGVNFKVTGHSLGGSEAMWVARENPGVTANVFNPGIVGPSGEETIDIGSMNTILDIFGLRDKDYGSEYNNINVLRMDGDLVSAGFWSRMGTNDIDYVNDDGTAGRGDIVKWQAIGESETRPYGDNGIHLVNAKFDNPELTGIAWSLGAHELTNFLTDEEAEIYKAGGKSNPVSITTMPVVSVPITAASTVNAARTRQPRGHVAKSLSTHRAKGL